MKKEKAQSSSLVPKLILVALVLTTVLIVSGVGFFLILPTFGQLSTINQEVAQQKSTAEKISRSISALKAQDQAEIKTISNFLSTLIPAQIDMLHFATLNEIIAKASGAEITNIQLSTGKTALPPKSQSTSAKTATNQTSQVAVLTAIVSYNSNFNSLIKLIRYWVLADQAVGLDTATITGQSSGVIGYTITYNLPISKTTPKASVNDTGVLTKAQITELKALQDRITYTATPSAKPLGISPNPFKH